MHPDVDVQWRSVQRPVPIAFGFEYSPCALCHCLNPHWHIANTVFLCAQARVDWCVVHCSCGVIVRSVRRIGRRLWLITLVGLRFGFGPLWARTCKTSIDAFPPRLPPEIKHIL